MNAKQKQINYFKYITGLSRTEKPKTYGKTQYKEVKLLLPLESLEEIEVWANDTEISLPIKRIARTMYNRVFYIYECPICKANLDNNRNQYCFNCGQKLHQGETNEP